MNVTTTVIIDDEVYVYVRGRLIMKRWRLSGGSWRSVVFHVGPNGVRWNGDDA